MEQVCSAAVPNEQTARAQHIEAKKKKIKLNLKMSFHQKHAITQQKEETLLRSRALLIQMYPIPEYQH